MLHNLSAAWMRRLTTRLGILNVNEERRLGQEVSAAHDPQASPISIDHRVGAVAPGLEPGEGVLGRGRGRKRLDLGGHHLVHRCGSKHVDVIFGLDAEAPPGELLRHQAVAHQRGRHQVGHHAGEHQRQDDLIVVGQFEHEHDGGERGSRGRAEQRRHGHDGERARREMQARRHPGADRAQDAADRCADEQQRGEGSAGGSGAQRHPPRSELRHAQDGDRSHGQPGGQDVTDGVVPHSQGPRDEHADEPEGGTADDRVPELANREPRVKPFDLHQSAGDDHGEQPTGQAQDHEEGQLRQARVHVVGNSKQRSGAEECRVERRRRPRRPPPGG